MNTTTWKDRYDLKNAEWKFDKIPEILDGQNIAGKTALKKFGPKGPTLQQSR